MRVCIGTLAQKCHSCNRKLKKEPFARYDAIVNSGVYGGSPSAVNLCHKCLTKATNEVLKKLNDPEIAEELFLYNLDK